MSPIPLAPSSALVLALLPRHPIAALWLAQGRGHKRRGALGFSDAKYSYTTEMVEGYLMTANYTGVMMQLCKA